MSEGYDQKQQEKNETHIQDDTTYNLCISTTLYVDVVVWVSVIILAPSSDPFHRIVRATLFRPLT